jgi:hypothetical protein
MKLNNINLNQLKKSAIEKRIKKRIRRKKNKKIVLNFKVMILWTNTVKMILNLRQINNYMSL